MVFLAIIVFMGIAIYLVAVDLSETKEDVKKNYIGCLFICLTPIVLVLVVLFGFAWLLFSDLAAEVNVSEYKYSPNKIYTAYEVDYAGSVIGDDYTYIYVKEYKQGDENKEKAYKRGEVLYIDYIGNPVDFKWKSDNCLIIEGEEYIIDY